MKFSDARRICFASVLAAGLFLFGFFLSAPRRLGAVKTIHSDRPVGRVRRVAALPRSSSLGTRPSHFAMLEIGVRSSDDSIHLTQGAEPFETDRFGGIEGMRCPGRTGRFFSVQKIRNRWVFCSPAGNVFWLRSVYNVVPAASVIGRKYGGRAQRWGTSVNTHLKGWGFNTLGEYTSTSPAIPIGAYGAADGNSVKLPFILLLTPAMDSMQNPHSIGLPQAVKDIIQGVPRSTYDDWRGPLVDAYDPKFSTAARAEVSYWMNAFTGGFSGTPWIVGITIDDADKLYGFKSGGNAPVVKYPHPAFMVATTNFLYPGYADPQLHSKYAWVEWLKAKYNNSISALNQAWGTNGFYTAFDDAAGYGVGTGVIDENGQHQAWMGSDPWMLSNASTGVQADLNGFLYQFCLKYAQIQVAAIRAVDQNHLIFGPAALNNYGAMARPQVLQGLSDGGVQVFQLNYNPLTSDMSGDNATYDLTGKPAFIWYSVTGQADSALSGSGLAYGQPDFGTQAARGQHYASDMQTFLNARGANGDFYVMGFDWWDLYDATGGGENTNWGLYTPRDNAYDGREAIIAAGTDPWGYPTGGEAANYGDFLSAATRANVATTRAVITALKTP